ADIGRGAQRDVAAHPGLARQLQPPMPTRRTSVRQKLPCPAHPRLQCSRARSTDPNTYWSERARAPTWYPSSCDLATGGAGGLPPSTPLSKLFSRLLGLA